MAKKITTAPAANAKVRKSTAGIPRITNGVLAMSEADRAKWLDESCKDLTAEVKAEVAARLATVLKEGRKGKAKTKTVDFAAMFKGRTVKELGEAQTALSSALADAATAEEDTLNKVVAEAQQKLEAIAAARKAKESVPA